jgi:hypothetical protein
MFALAHGAAGQSGGAPATAPAVGERLSVSDFVNMGAAKLQAMVVFPTTPTGTVLFDRPLPDDPDDALVALNDMLAPAGYQAIASRGQTGRLLLRVGTLTEARRAAVAQSPVTYGVDPAKIDVSERSRIVTHVVPLTHGDLLPAIERSLAEDKDVSVTVAGTGKDGDRCQLILSGPAGNVRQAVRSIVAVDKPAAAEDAQLVRLQKLSPEAAMEALARQFPENGDAGLHYVADMRTRSILFSGPSSALDSAVLLLKGLDAAAPEPRLPDIQIPERTPSLLPFSRGPALPAATQPAQQVVPPAAGRAGENR